MEFNFAENTSVDSIDKIPTDFRGLYVEQDGKHVLRSDDDGVKSAVAAITGLNRSLVAARAEAKANKGKAVDLSTLGESPEAILEAFTAKLTETKKAASGKGAEDLERQVAKAKEELAKAHATEMQSRDARIQALTGQLHSLLVIGEATKALAEANALDADLLMPFVQKQLKVNEEDGKFTVSVMDDAGDPRYSGVTGSPMSIKELVAEMKGADKYKPLFKSEAPAGGGMQTGHRPSQQVRQGQQQGDMSATDKIAAGLRKGQHVRGAGS